MSKEKTTSAKKTINNTVFFSSFFFILVITLMATIWPDALNVFFQLIQSWILDKTGWIYILGVAIVMFIAIWLMVSRVGDIKLGPDHSEPDHKNLSWFAMLFSAGIGIGLIFFGVAEPIMHFSSPPLGEGSTIESAREAMKITFFHWGFHAWALYGVYAATMAYFCYRKNLPLLPRSAFYPFLGDKIYGIMGDIVDTAAVIGTMFGVATSLGFGVCQVNAGLNYLFDVPQNPQIQIILIIVITLMATISVVLGLEAGIKKLSNVNIILACILLLCIIFMTDAAEIMRAFVQNTGTYLSDIIYKTFNLYAYERKESWLGGWTLLYWGWWISWTPFVGMFIARISRGRTLREFMCGVLFIPSGFTFLWMTTFGNTAISMVLKDGATELVDAVNTNVPIALFKFFEYLPCTTFLSILGLVLIITFFVSSSDSGSLVIDTLTSGGVENPPVWQRIFWALLEGVVASTLLLAGGLEALQTMAIVTAFPIIFVILIGAFALIRSLKADYQLLQSVQNHTTSIQYTQASTSWKERLSAMISNPGPKEAGKFLNKVVLPGLTELRDEMIRKGLDVDLDNIPGQITLVVRNDDVEDFRYQIRLRSFEVPGYVHEKNKSYFRAEVFLLNGGQNYDVFGYTQEQIVADAVTQYEKHFHFLHMANSEIIKPEQRA